jgi:hypothetical protein
MIRKLGATTMAVGTMIVLLGAAVDADATGARVRCRVKAARTQISVDGRDLTPGLYSATVDSSTDAAGAVASKAGVQVAGRVDEAEFDFDSNRGNVAAGATQLPASFVARGDSVTWQLLQNGVPILAGTQACGR